MKERWAAFITRFAEMLGLVKREPKLEVERATAINNAIYTALSSLDAEAYPIDVYLAGTQVVILMNMGGKLYTMSVAEAPDGTITAGTPIEVPITAQAQHSSVHLSRQADGRYRWFAIAAAAVINKANQIDSRELFDDFVDRFNKGRSFSIDFFHDERMPIGTGDFLARCENLLLGSGLVAENELGQAFIEADAAGRGEWGMSPYFGAEAYERLQVAGDTEIPVYTKGYLIRIAVLPTKDACNFFTRIIAEKEQAMDTRTREALVTLFGDEAKADAFIQKVEETNRTIAEEGLLTRSASTDVEQTTTEQIETLTTEKPTTEPAPAGEQTETPDAMTGLVMRMEELAGLMTQSVTQLNTELAAQATRMSAYESTMAELKQAVAEFKRTDEEKQAQWLADLPANRGYQPVTYRPRTERRTVQEGERINSEVTASATLAKLPSIH